MLQVPEWKLWYPLNAYPAVETLMILSSSGYNQGHPTDNKQIHPRSCIEEPDTAVGTGAAQAPCHDGVCSRRKVRYSVQGR